MIEPEQLRYYPYFAGIGPASLQKIARMTDIKTVEAGAVLFREKDAATHLYVLTRGQFDVVLAPTEDREVTVYTVVPGELLAWSSLMRPYRLTAKAIARERSTLLAIDAPKLRDLRAEDHDLGYRLMREVAKALANRFEGSISQLAAV